MAASCKTRLGRVHFVAGCSHWCTKAVDSAPCKDAKFMTNPFYLLSLALPACPPEDNPVAYYAIRYVGQEGKFK